MCIVCSYTRELLTVSVCLLVPTRDAFAFMHLPKAYLQSHVYLLVLMLLYAYCLCTCFVLFLSGCKIRLYTVCMFHQCDMHDAAGHDSYGTHSSW